MNLSFRSYKKSFLTIFLTGCASMFHAPVDEDGTNFTSSKSIQPRSFSADVSFDLYEIKQFQERSLASQNSPQTVQLNQEKNVPNEVLNLEQVSTEEGLQAETLAVKSQTGSAGQNLTKLDNKTMRYMSQSSRTGKLIKHKVSSSDTLMKLAFKYKGNVYRWKEIYHRNKNKISDFNKLESGTVLEIYATVSKQPRPAGYPYNIIWGDTLTRISGKLYGNKHKWKYLWRHNNQMIRNPNKIYAGFNLYYEKNKSPQSRPIFRTPSSNEKSNTLPIQLIKDKQS